MFSLHIGASFLLPPSSFWQWIPYFPLSMTISAALITLSKFGFLFVYIWNFDLLCVGLSTSWPWNDGASIWRTSMKHLTWTAILMDVSLWLVGFAPRVYFCCQHCASALWGRAEWNTYLNAYLNQNEYHCINCYMKAKKGVGISLSWSVLSDKRVLFSDTDKDS